jgi:hypothetical protein
MGSRASSVSIVTRLRLDNWSSNPCGGNGGTFSLRHRVHTGSEAHPAFYTMGTAGSCPGGKAAGAWILPLICI